MDAGPMMVLSINSGKIADQALVALA